jgi:hypothetical protein
VREICMLRSTRRGLETWHGRDGVTLADERARQRGTQTSTFTGAPVLDPTGRHLILAHATCYSFICGTCSGIMSCASVARRT